MKQGSGTVTGSAGGMGDDGAPALRSQEAATGRSAPVHDDCMTCWRVRGMLLAPWLVPRLGSCGLAGWSESAPNALASEGKRCPPEAPCSLRIGGKEDEFGMKNREKQKLPDDKQRPCVSQEKRCKCGVTQRVSARSFAAHLAGTRYGPGSVSVPFYDPGRGTPFASYATDHRAAPSRNA